MEGEPLDEVQWRSPEWIQMYGLRTDNVLEYFSQSPFYDRSSNNQVLKMQSQFNESLQGKQDLYGELKNMKGIEFVVAVAKEPEMWVIRKQDRLSPQEARQLATYFVVGENIYMAPTIYDILSSRLLSTTHSLSQALSIASSLPTYVPSQGYSYQIAPTAASTEDQPNTPSSSSAGAGAGAGQKSKTKSGALASTTNTPTPGPNSSSQPQASGSSGQYGPVLDDANKADRSIARALGVSLARNVAYLDDPQPEPKRRPPQRS